MGISVAVSGTVCSHPRPTRHGASASCGHTAKRPGLGLTLATAGRFRHITEASTGPQPRTELGAEGGV